MQVVCSSRRGSREIEHIGSAHDEAGLEAVKAAARQRMAAGQLELDLGLGPAGCGPLPITSSGTTAKAAGARHGKCAPARRDRQRSERRASDTRVIISAYQIVKNVDDHPCIWRYTARRVQ